MITQKLVQSLFGYSYGNLIRKVRTSSNTNIGEIVGCINNVGYSVVSVENKLYLVHRIIFLWHHGYLPENDVDHIDRNKSNNKIENLREISHRCNSRNTKIYSHNTSGITGVTANGDSWVAQIHIDKHNNYLGRFKNFDDAVLARWRAECKYGWKGCNSDTPSYLYLKNKGLIPKRKILKKKMFKARTIISHIGTMEERRTALKQLKRMKDLGLQSV